jgi:hypothetical protein
MLQVNSAFWEVRIVDQPAAPVKAVSPGVVGVGDGILVTEPEAEIGYKLVSSGQPLHSVIQAYPVNNMHHAIRNNNVSLNHQGIVQEDGSVRICGNDELLPAAGLEACSSD